MNLHHKHKQYSFIFAWLGMISHLKINGTSFKIQLWQRKTLRQQTKWKLIPRVFAK